MRCAGIDIGSRTVKLVVVEDCRPVHVRVVENTFNPLAVCANLLEGIDYSKVVATGYGRHLFKSRYECEVISEIKAFALGVYAEFPSARTILDIGGQDIKAIALDSSGKMNKFEMNDKCAAGTGRFLEIMAMALGSPLDEFGDLAMSAGQIEKINAMCTVFAESEVVSLLASGASRENVAAGIHQAITHRALMMLKRVVCRPDVVFVGGVALNPCIRKLIADQIGFTLLTPKSPQTIGALGGALHACQLARSGVTTAG